MSLKINKREFKQWVAALDSGEYKQGKGKLHNENNEYCCLGVACKITIPKHLIQCSENVISGGLPSIQRAAPQWLREINDDFNDKTNKSLSSLNDEDGYTFPEIATLLELVYVHKMLD